MAKAKKILNDPARVVPELLEGVVAASGGRVRQVPGVAALVKSRLPEGKVGLVIGGGSGHEPLFPGFVGDNLADAAACGHVFAAPSPDIILAATRAAHQGHGVLYLYGNYAGDNLNFDMAAELAAEEGIVTRTVRVWDDVAAAPPARMQERRGIAGMLLVLKVAGAAAAVLPDLESVHRVAVLARDQTRSLGVAVAAGSMPETGEPTFELGDDEIEVGMGLHGEPGVRREKLPAADALVENMVQGLVADLPFHRGDEVCLLVNDLGSTTWLELLIATRKAHQVLKQGGISIYDTLVGSYCTCQEMAGFSLSLLRLNPELKRYYDMPARSLAFSRGQWDE